MAKESTNMKMNLEKEKRKDVSKPNVFGGVLQDERFQHLVSDPRFKIPTKVERKVKIDERFQEMFTNNKFKVKCHVDKYGRKMNKSSSEDLRRYYELNSDEDDEENLETEERLREEQAILQDEKSDKFDDSAKESEEIVATLSHRLLDPNIDYARGEGDLLTDSSSDESESSEEEPVLSMDNVRQEWGELKNDAETIQYSTHRLALCNMDWDRIRAIDLMILFSSFLSPGGSILSVKIYPSEFGKARMAEEDLHGPPELVNSNRKTNRDIQEKNEEDSESGEDLLQEQDSDAEEGDDYHIEKLRQYQLSRLRYYYAIVECDGADTADKIYKECDGLEYESSATLIDLRFVPNDTNFDGDEPTDVCYELPDVSSYKPRQFTTTALQQAKVDLTWDETAIDRKELGEKLSSGKLDDISEKELRKIVACSSEDEDKDNYEGESDTQRNEDKESERKLDKKEEIISKYKALLAEISEKELKEKEGKKYDMEFTWQVSNDNEVDNKKLDLSETDKKVLTPIEKILQKRAVKNKKRKEERKRKKLQFKHNEGGIENSDAGSDSTPDDIDMNDPYFTEEFANGDFIEPFGKVKERNKKRKNLKSEDNEEDEKQVKELELLLDDDEANEQFKQHFSLAKIIKTEQEKKSKKKRHKYAKKSKDSAFKDNLVEDTFEMNVNDERFKAVFNSHEFNIDPTNPHFKKTNGMEKLISEKMKRKCTDDDVQKPPTTNKKQIENALLVRSLKRKIRMN
ncbi:pre-rRNA-processing protein esf1 [Glossina fuscipes]|uniref:Pre-rRNA-processing protein esf1 n=1 Tax=Glossina fuscipes TaxID=7396 RepID=A0A8U0WHD0_9MUSC|nr:pre-rRNA-processing protein esf1 [Glossina fuscipes]KAI9590702.1 hypothetical protein GQX74_008869 [Glossina fuscipes]